ncbi:carbon-nitrogen hydrolase family protein [Campylobacter sp. RM9328]|uniref:carbon-nitrogen hydrolase family protein n=1 Tax=Campylobacter sp. RM9328 TaxID=1705720 RepID=UPI001474583A|nr:carbon-nitrogen hydrolase family protein [Campylobacter sp. RM9328]
MTSDQNLTELNLYPVTLSASNVQLRKLELMDKISQAPRNSLMLASELCVSGYDFDGFFAGANSAMLPQMLGSFDSILMEELQDALSEDKFLAFTHLKSIQKTDTTKEHEKVSARIFNEFVILNDTQVFHAQSKTKLFRPNLEHEKFSVADESEVKIFEFKGIKVGVLICFELRFIDLWQRLKSAEIILVPAMWGKERKEAFVLLCKALAMVNICYVVVASSLDLEFSGVFLPDGEFKKSIKFDRNLITQLKQNLEIM